MRLIAQEWLLLAGRIRSEPECWHVRYGADGGDLVVVDDGARVVVVAEG
jgi:hypothetical protein